MFNDKGISLVGAMVAVAILGVLSAGIVSMFQQMSLAQSTHKYKLGVENFQEDLRAILGSREACLNTFGNTLLNAATNANFTLVKNGANQNFVTTNTPINDRSAEITSMRLNNYRDMIPPEGVATFEVVYTARSSVYGGAALPRTILIQTRKDAGNRLIGCVALAKGISGETTSGTVMAFAGTQVPPGWLACDGSQVSRTTYAQLYAAIGNTYGAGNGSTTFNLPDLRGEFIRGVDAGRGVDPGRVLGQLQNQQLQDHTHISGSYCDSCIGSVYPGGTYVSQVYVVGYHSNAMRSTIPVTGSHGTETRPRNVALQYIIKY